MISEFVVEVDKKVEKVLFNSKWPSGGLFYEVESVDSDGLVSLKLDESRTEDKEWSGEGLPPVGVECEFFLAPGIAAADEMIEWADGDGVTVKFVDNGTPVCLNHRLGVYSGVCPECLRPIETPQQREERERLEAAYDLYLTRLSSSDDFVPYTYDEFLGEKDTKFGFLAIVDKTGYRKAK